MSKLSQEELSTITEFRTKITEVGSVISDLVLRRLVMNKMINEHEEEFVELVFQENEYMQSLIDKYGEEGLQDLSTDFKD